ncbi:MAG: ParB/RepB/Spo0J family partition protein [Verrucomicrobia bacterium]|nr:ParB/RepB/Spo0J family partition protein [Verrucomicrobiota bacterium]
MALKHGLGRGLDALIKDGTNRASGSTASGDGPQEIPIASIKAASWQPRREFDEQALADLTQSIAEHGILQPLLVRPKGQNFELMAGERRLRAATRAGLTAVPVIIRDVDDQSAFQLALIENLQREDLTVLEEAQGYRELINTYKMTQDEVSQHVGKARATIANALRLLSLPEAIRNRLEDGTLSAGHAKILTGLETDVEQTHFANRVVKESLSVRQLEKAVSQGRRVTRKPRAAKPDVPVHHLSYLTDKLQQHFGTGIRLIPSRTFANGKKGKGSLEIDFYSNEDLDRILDVLGLSGD